MLKLSHIRLNGGNKILLEDEKLIAEVGQMTLICGESGCGKSTLLYEIGLLSNHQDIQYMIDEVDVRKLSNKELLCLKRYEIGYVFQTSDLFENEDINYNISHFASLVNKTVNEEDILAYLKLLDLNIDIHQKIKTLSGGEKQRIAIICALVKDSQVLVLDEITSALDSDNEEKIFQLLKNIAVSKNIIVIMVSHSAPAKKYADRIYEIKDRHLVCIKDSKMHGSLKLDLKRTLKLPFQQYIEYTLRYFHRYFFLNILLIFSFICGLSFLSFVDYYQQHYKNTILSEVNQLSYNEIWVYDGKQTQQENTKIKKLIESFDINTQIYPYFKGQCIIDHQMIDVIPFYKNDKNSQLLSFEGNNDTNIYISEDVSSSYTDTLKINQKEIGINGIFKNGIRLYNSEYQFIAMDDKTAIQYVDQIRYNGYIVRTENFNDLVKLQQLLANQSDLHIDSSMQDIDVLSQYIDHAQQLMSFYTLGAIVFVLFIFSIFYILYYYSRRYEISYLKVNGYTNSQLSFLLALENIIRFICCIIPSIIITAFIKYFILQMNMSISSLIIYNLILSLLFIIIPYLFSCIYVALLKPVKTYRK